MEQQRLPIEWLPIKFTQLFINGSFVDSVSEDTNSNTGGGRCYETRDPRTGEVLVSVAEGDKADVDLAVAATHQAFDHGKWPRMSAYVCLSQLYLDVALSCLESVPNH